MNHPNREEWMSYLYDESGQQEIARLAAHLRACPECHARVKAWQTARKSMNAWQLPARPRSPIDWPALRWAAAAAIVLLLGFGIGRLTMPRIDPGELRATIEPEIRNQLQHELSMTLRQELAKTTSAAIAVAGAETRELLADYAEALENQRAEDAQTISLALEGLETRQLANYLSLKKDLDTVAFLTDTWLRETRHDLIQLADYQQPVASQMPAK